MRSRVGIPLLICICLFTGALSAGLLLSRSTTDSYDGDIMSQVTVGMITNGDLRVHRDSYKLNTPYSNYGLGMSLLMAGPYEVAHLLHHDTTSAMAKTNAVIFALTALVLLGLARLAGGTWRQALLVSLLVSMGTMLLAYVPTSVSEPGTALFVAVALLALEGQRQSRRWAPAVAGLAVGGALLMRTDSAAVIAPAVALGLFVLGPRLRTVAWFAVGMVPLFAVWAWYNNYRYGSPAKLGYAKDVAFNYPWLRGAYGLTLSSGRGLLWYVPLILVAAGGAWWAWKRSWAILAVCVVLLVGRIALYASWSSWAGGASWGPRFLVPAMPALAVPILEVVRRFPVLGQLRKAAVVVVSALSIGIQIVGAVVYYLTYWYQVLGSPLVRSPDLYFFHWKYFPITGELPMLTHRSDWSSGYLNPGVATHTVALLVTVLAVSIIGLVVAAYRTGRPMLHARAPAARQAPSEPQRVKTAAE